MWNGSPAKKVRKRRCDGGGDGLWQRTILLGDKCRPLDFEGVIHYDGEGRLLVVPPRSPLRSPLPSFQLPSAVSSGNGGKY
ncbi:unnamed protein product [Spirodela intermedia]|uniref:Uncharacterized protein n=1 Tax=Spirodela intermedia TaxID=51605 RepID=A0A7I8J653_SPIIN|nr:unnamed protein product [Spirodela intermedia]CAA6665470.1 unnamed protein product [Spirodela intermedia]